MILLFLMECGPFNAFDDRALCPSWSLHHRSDSKGQCYLCLRVQDQGTSLAGQWLRLHLLMQGVQVREIRSHMPRGQKNQNIRQKQYCNKFNKDFKNGPLQKKILKKKKSSGSSELKSQLRYLLGV